MNVCLLSCVQVLFNPLLTKCLESNRTAVLDPSVVDAIMRLMIGLPATGAAAGSKGESEGAQGSSALPDTTAQLVSTCILSTSTLLSALMLIYVSATAQ